MLRWLVKYTEYSYCSSNIATAKQRVKKGKMSETNAIAIVGRAIDKQLLIL